MESFLLISALHAMFRVFLSSYHNNIHYTEKKRSTNIQNGNYSRKRKREREGTKEKDGIKWKSLVLIFFKDVQDEKLRQEM